MSPSDLAKACGMFPKLRLPVRLKTFKSGLIVVQDSSTSEEIMERNLLRYIASLNQGATPLDIGAQFHWSVGVAMEVLQVPPMSFSSDTRWRKKRVCYVEMSLLKVSDSGKIGF